MRKLTFVVSVALAFTAAVAAEAPSKASIYVFYSEPPFEYQLVQTIEIKVGSMWDREKIERRIRRRVARAGGDVIILERSFMQVDEPTETKVVRTPRGTRAHVRVPLRSAYVAGRIAKRVEEESVPDNERLYARTFDAVWQSVIQTMKQSGWRIEKVDTDSRYLTTEPTVTSALAMQCDDDGDRGEDGWLPARFTAYVNSFTDESWVRLDVAFIDPSTGAPADCRSVGAYEQAFFSALDRRIGNLD